jgi:hypothetical protein
MRSIRQSRSTHHSSFRLSSNGQVLEKQARWAAAWDVYLTIVASFGLKNDLETLDNAVQRLHRCEEKLSDDELIELYQTTRVSDRSSRVL